MRKTMQNGHLTEQIQLADYPATIVIGLMWIKDQCLIKSVF